MNRLIFLLFIATIVAFPAILFSADCTIEIDSKSAQAGESLFLRMMLTSDIPISAMVVPMNLDHPDIIIDSVSWEYTAFDSFFSDTTNLCDTMRIETVSIFPWVKNPIPSVDPPGGEICRIFITIRRSVSTVLIEVDTAHTDDGSGSSTDGQVANLSDNLGNSIYPNIIPGGIQVLQATDVEENDISLPRQFNLEQNYPNPFNPVTTISFYLPKSDYIRLEVFDVLGRYVASLAEGHYSAGSHQVAWEASSKPSGVYFYRLTTSENNITRKMTLIK